MQDSVRRVLEKSQVAIAVLGLLMLWAVGNLFIALAIPAQHLLTYVGTAILILDVPVLPSTIEMRVALIEAASYLLSGLVELGLACLISAWVFRTGPVTALKTVFKERKDAWDA